MTLQEQLELSLMFENAPPPGEKRVAVVIGRFNPPTKGHYAVINKVKSFIKGHPELRLESAPLVIVIGGSTSDSDKSRNPLSVADRILFMKASGHTDGVIFQTASDAFGALAGARNAGFEPIAIAAGSDRIEGYVEMLDKYFTNSDGSKIKHYAVHLARDSESGNQPAEIASSAILDSMKSGKDLSTDLVSGSLARRAAELGYEDEFADIVGLSNKPVLAKKLFKKVKDAILDKEHTK